MIFKQTARWTAVGAVTLVILLAILFGLAQTEIGKRQLARQVARGLGGASNARIEVGKIEGIIPFDFRVDRLISSDTDGEMLALEDVSFHWSLGALLRGRFHIKELSASLLQLNRLPTKDKSDETTPKKLPVWPSALNRLSVERFAIDRLIVDPEVFGEAGIFRLEAHLTAVNAADEQTAEIHLARVDGPKAEATLHITFNHKELSLRLRAKVEEAEGGVLAALMNLPGPVVLNLEGAGALRDWKGILKAGVGGLGELETSLFLETLDGPKLKAEGKMRVHSDRLPAQLRRLLSDETRVAMTLRMPHSQSVRVDYLNVDGNKISLRLKGTVDFEQQHSTGQFSLTCEDLALLENPGGIKIAGSMEVDSRFSGPLLNPQTTLLVNIRNVAFDKFRADAMHADLRIGLVSPLSKEFSGIILSGGGSLENFAHPDVQPMPEKEFRWSIDAEGPFKEIVQIRKFRLSGEKTSLETSGNLSLTDLSGKGEVSLVVEDLRKISGLFKADIPGRTKIHVSFDGNATKRLFTAQIQGQLNMSEASSSRLTPLLGPHISYAGQIKLTDENKVSISKLQLDTVPGKVTGAVSLDLASQELNSALRIVVPKLAFLSPVLTRTIDGSLEMDSVVTGTLSSPKVSVKANAKNLVFEQVNLQTLTARIHTKGLPPSIQGHSELRLKYAGQAVSGRGDFSLEGARLGLSALSIKSGENELTGKLTLDLKSLLAEGELQGNARRLSDLSFLLGEDLAGGAVIKTKFEIVNNKQKIGLDLDGWNLKSGFGHAKELDLKARLVDPLKKPSGNFDLKGSGFRFGDATLATLALAGEGKPEKITFQGKTSGKVKDRFDLETRGILHVTSKAQTLELNAFGAHYKDLPLKLLAPAAIHRTSTGYHLETLSLQVGGGQLDGSGRLENQTVTLKTDFKKLPLGDLPIAKAPQFTGTATGSLSLLGPIGRPQGSLNLSLDDLSLRDAKVSDLPPATLNAKAKLTDSMLLAELTLKGLTAKPFDARLNIPLTLSLSPFTGSLPSQGDLRGDLTGEIDLARTSALTGLRDQKLEGLLDFSLKFGGTVANPKLDGGIHLNKGAYRGIRSKTASASIRFQGPVDRPSGDIELRIEDVSFQEPQASELPPARVEAKAELRKRRLKSNVTLQGLTAEPLAATLDIPLILSFFPFTFSMPSKDEILGNLAGDLDLERINTLFGPDYQIVKGHFGADFALTGTVDTPRIAGQAKLGKGYYEYIPTGTVLRDAEVEITAEIPRVSIKEARATDGEKGAISLDGWFDLLPGDQFPFKTTLTLEQATLIRRDDITATTGGQLILSGSVEKAKLTGQLHVEHAEFRIPDQLPPDITDLQVIEILETGQQGEPPPQPRANQGLELLLDMAVDGPGKIFVRGRGLDSEWNCELRIAGTAHKPVITGDLSVVRGRFDFLGKRFDIQSGTIAFNGAYPPSPIADIVTEAEANDITAELQLSGSLKSPKLTLTSDPPLPSDEILSRVLFGRTLTTITPFQALTLADAARTLAGGGGPGVMEKTRKILGVDQLEIKTDGEEADQATVGAGKYLSDRVYLEVEQGMDPQSSKAKVQVEVTPNITVESEVGANSEGGMGVRWKWDY